MEETIIKGAVAAKRIGVSIKKIRYMSQSGEFPKPIKIGKSDGWIETEVDAWIKQKIADRDAAAAGGTE